MLICVVALACISPASPALVRLAANQFSTPSPRQNNIVGVPVIVLKMLVTVKVVKSTDTLPQQELDKVHTPHDHLFGILLADFR